MGAEVFSAHQQEKPAQPSEASEEINLSEAPTEAPAQPEEGAKEVEPSPPH